MKKIRLPLLIAADGNFKQESASMLFPSVFREEFCNYNSIMILSATFSKPTGEVENSFGRPYIKIRIWKAPNVPKTGAEYFFEGFTQKQSFQKTLSETEVNALVEKHAGTTFKNAVIRTETEETNVMSNRHGEIKRLVKKIPLAKENSLGMKQSPMRELNRKKNYIINEGTAVPFLVELGVMTKDGKVVASKYDKFRQINRFLEFISDIIDEVVKQKGEITAENPLKVIDFGSGKSYLTFAVYYYLTGIKNLPVDITGLDLKEDVIRNCESLARKLGCSNLHFKIGNIADYDEDRNPDIIITLHACDVATDYALQYAVSRSALAILSVPCCQHEVNQQLNKIRFDESSPFSSIAKHGILQERFAAIVTDALRSEYLEKEGYSVQVLEFIDMEHTPKNLLIRAVKKRNSDKKNAPETRARTLLDGLGVCQSLWNES